MSNLIRAAGLAAILAAAPAAAERLPVNPAVTPATIGATICVPGWTRTVRPYVGRMVKIKARMLAAIGEPHSHRNRYELDHIIPLALGGAPLSLRNLRLEPIAEARVKDQVEVCLQAAVCGAGIALEAARAAIWEDWRSAADLCVVNPLKE